VTEPEHHPRFERARQRKAALEARAKQLAERGEAERSRHASVDAAYEMVDRDLEVGGGIVAGALAYRLFIWLLPLALVVVAGLGIAAHAESESPQDAANSLGLAGLVSNSIATSSKGSARWYALIVGIPILLFATRSVLRVMIGIHRLVWTDVRARAPRPTFGASAMLLGALVMLFVISGVASALRAWSAGWGLLATIAVVLPYAGLWLLVSRRLPHRESSWQALIPGALVFGVGIEVIHIVAAYFIAPYAVAKQGTYGALGVAAALLVGLFLISRLIVGAAIVNATLSERRTRAAQPGTAAPTRD
jgi:uncharacterized BrkB/YihY/UPF0761 family membrane protein